MSTYPATQVRFTHYAYTYVVTIPYAEDVFPEEVWAAIGDESTGDVRAHFAYAPEDGDGTVTYRGTIVVTDDGDQGWHRDILASLVGTVCRCYCRCGDAHGGYCDDTDACNTPVVTPDQITLALTRVPGFMA